MITLTERKSRLCQAVKIKDRTADTARRVIQKMSGLQNVKSGTQSINTNRCAGPTMKKKVDACPCTASLDTTSYCPLLSRLLFEY